MQEGQPIPIMVRTTGQVALFPVPDEAISLKTMPFCKRILVVDDEEQILFVLKNALKKLGGHVEIVTARNGCDALEEARKSAFDLLITDLKMPVMDGIELTAEIKGLHPETAIVWITAYGSCVAEGEAERLQVFCCLHKPLEIHEIREAAWKALENSSMLKSQG